MSTPTAARVLRNASRTASRWTTTTRQSGQWKTSLRKPGLVQVSISSARCFSTSIRYRAGLMPDTHDPQPPNRVEEHRVTTPTEISKEEYELRADEYMDAIHEQAEAIQEEREDVEVEYSAGVLSINIPPAGTYVINKQPPNKQIWLSSPTSGPKRYDWVLDDEGMHQKEGGGEGEWIYLRDGTKLTDLLSKELGLSVDLHRHGGHADDSKGSVDPFE